MVTRASATVSAFGVTDRLHRIPVERISVRLRPQKRCVVAAASLALTALSSIACQRKSAPPHATSVVPAYVHCAGGRHVVRERFLERCVLSDGTLDGPLVIFADETRKVVTTEGQYENGKQSGRWVETYGGGVQLRSEYSEGQPHGDWKWWHANGMKKGITHYEHGQELGRSEEWDTEGRLTSSVEHQPGGLRGRFFVVSIESMVQVEGNYVDGQREGRWVWTHLSHECSSDGYRGPLGECARPAGIAWAGNYHSGQREGLWSSYHEEGTLESQGEYQHDKKEGVWRYFSFEGKPSEVISCRSGRAHGPYRRWAEFDLPHVSSPVHQLILRGAFRDGQPVGAWWLTDYPGERSQEIVCKFDEFCPEPSVMWSDIIKACETTEFQVQ